MVLALVESIVGSWIFLALGGRSDAGIVVSVVVAFVGAAIVIAAQRKIWSAHA